MLKMVVFYPRGGYNAEDRGVLPQRRVAQDLHHIQGVEVRNKQIGLSECCGGEHIRYEITHNSENTRNYVKNIYWWSYLYVYTYVQIYITHVLVSKTSGVVGWGQTGSFILTHVLVSETSRVVGWGQTGRSNRKVKREVHQRPEALGSTSGHQDGSSYRTSPQTLQTLSQWNRKHTPAVTQM